MDSENKVNEILLILEYLIDSIDLDTNDEIWLKGWINNLKE